MTQSPVSLNRIVTAPRWTADEAREVLAWLAESGLSVAEFAAHHSIQAQRIYLWRRKLAASETHPAKSRPAFVELDARVTTPTLAARYELVTTHGETLRIEGPVDADSVRTLLGILREGRAC